MIVRELVTKLGFQVDRTNLDRFERSIVGFKTKFALAATGIGLAVRKTVDFFSGIADAVVQTKDLADFAGVAVKEFVALRNVAEKFNIRPEQFNDAFQRLSLSIKEASRGAGEFFEIVKQTNGRINFKNAQGELLKTTEVFRQIIDYINTIEDRSEKLRILGNIFSPDQAGAWLRIVEQGPKAIDQMIEKELQFSDAFEKNVDDAIRFQRELNTAGKELTKLIHLAATPVLSFLGKSVGGINVIADTTKEKGFFGGVNLVGEAIADAFNTFVGRETLSNVQKQVEQDDAEFLRRFKEQEINRINNQNQATVINNNTFDFNVPPGTTEQQAGFISDAIKVTLDSYWDEKTREVFNNNPQVE